jgi:predicted RNA-binding Zn-ribbon protein involved in translation (DUF1610 family)
MRCHPLWLVPIGERNRTSKATPCPDCGAPIGQRHREGCDVERCPHCGWSVIGCAHFHADDPRRQVWTGKWPGQEDCERLDFFVNDEPDFPDLNRLFTISWPTSRPHR